MAEPRGPAACDRRFPEEHLSGYLDRALTQGEEQRVRLHVERCPACRDELADLRGLREVTMSTRFEVPADDAWGEAPRTRGSRLSLRAGWALAVVWAVAVALYALWQVSRSADPVVEILVFGGLAAAVLLFLSVLLDRLRLLPGDRYRRVRR